MRWAEIAAADPHNPDRPWPTYQQMARWTTQGRLDARWRYDDSAPYHDWPLPEVEVACLAARLIAAGLSTVAAFVVARTPADTDGIRRAVIGYHIEVHLE
jgi:hypothetical protein